MIEHRDKRVSFTDRATALLAAAAVVAVAGALLRYVELVLLGLAGAVLVTAAVAWPGARTELGLRRVAVPHLVARGTRFTYELHVEPARSTADLQLVDQFSGSSLAPATIATARRAEVTVVGVEVAAHRRGDHRLGPVVEVRSDPFLLVRRDARHDLVDRVLVHPQVHSLRLSAASTNRPIGWRALIRSASDPLAEFRTLREYVPGDDHRLVHWPTAARLGTLMVREHLETRRPCVRVVLDCDEEAGRAESFEEAAEIACSLVCDALLSRYDVIARSSDPMARGASGSIKHREAALELFAQVAQVPPSRAIASTDLRLPAASAVDATIVVSPGPTKLGLALRASTVGGSLTVVEIGDDVDDGANRLKPGRTVTVKSAAGFAALWRSGGIL